MTRHVFFSFEYEHDVWRANVVRNSWVTRGSAVQFWDAADYEKVKAQGDAAIRRWIDNQLQGTSVTAVLVGEHTCQSKWVKYEIEQSINRGNGVLQIDIGRIEDQNRRQSICCGPMLAYIYSRYDWITHAGYQNIERWIEKAARQAGR